VSAESSLSGQPGSGEPQVPVTATDAPVTPPVREGRPVRVPTQTVVVRTERLTPHMVRVVLGGPGLAGFDPTEFTDRYVKLCFPPEVEGQRDRQRTYTVRWYDAAAGELAIDFVVHGDTGLAGPWAASAQAGDPMPLLGPGGAYAPAADADWHLLVGDESALPAIASALEAMPAGARVKVFLEVDGPDGELPLTSPATSVDGGPLVTWVHRGVAGHAVAGAEDSPLVEAVTGWEFPAGVPQVFLHGDAGFVRDIRRFLRGERDVPVSALSASGYWRRGRTEEGWRSDKAAWKADVDSDDAALAG